MFPEMSHFHKNLERLLWALILSCLIVCWRSYDKQTRVVVEGGRGLREGLGMRTHCSLACFATGSRCFRKLPLCLLQTGLKCTFVWGTRVSPQTSGDVINVRKTALSSLVTCSLVGPKKKKKKKSYPQTDIEQMLLFSFFLSSFFHRYGLLNMWIVPHHCRTYVELGRAGTFTASSSLEAKTSSCVIWNWL